MHCDEFWDKHESTAERCSEIFGIDDIMEYTVKEAWEHRDADCATACQDEYPFDEVTFEEFHWWVCHYFGVNCDEDTKFCDFPDNVVVEYDGW